jgi:predicted HicB family RNase H-like nuclease
MPKGPKLKTANLSLRIEPQTKAAARIAARTQRRSLANFIEVLILQYCKQHGIEVRTQRPSKGEQ